MNLLLPELSLVVLIGPSGSGKSSFARKHFLPTEVISSDQCRGMVSDDENDQTITGEAFELLNFIVRKRLALGRLTVIDATNVDKGDRARLVALAREFHVLPSAIVFKTPEGVCQERNRSRPDRDFGAHVIKRQWAMMRRGLKGLKREGFRSITTFDSVEEIEAVTGIERQPMWNNKCHESGPFDVVGDVHGCNEELRSLLKELGYGIDENTATHPEGRRLIFVGDLVDRGPDSPNVLRLVMDSVAAGTAFCVPGNHDAKLLRHLNGRTVQLTHGLDGTVNQLEADPLDHRDLQNFLDSLVSHLVLDEGRLVVAHAGLKEEMQGRGSGRVREFCLYGETTGERDEFGLPERLDWAASYRGKALVVHGHTPFAEPRWLNNTVNIDTGCAFGNRLTALRYPELEIVSVPALETYAESARPLHAERLTNAQQDYDRLLDLADVIGRRKIHTRLVPNLSVREENSMAALEVMSRFAEDPRWLIYLPPTMSPSATSEQDGWLERPEEGFAYFRSEGVTSVICEEKHMGSRAVVVVCREPSVAVTRFGLPAEARGSCFTRTGRPFFNDEDLSSGLLERLAAAVEKAGLWEELETDWLCLDCELMPWSVKARELLETQYAAVGAAGEAHVRAALELASSPAGNPGMTPEAVEDLSALSDRLAARGKSVSSYRQAYGHYCWDVVGIDDLKLAPFHILAGEGELFTAESHDWHMKAVERLAAADPLLFQSTKWREVSLEDASSEQDAVNWWEELTSGGGEGMVIKPRDFVTKGRKGVVQPAVKCRGREYLRIIYGPEYDLPEHLGRLRQRGLGHKRSMARREFALGLEALERFVERRPLREVHECVFAVLAMESEPVDPRL